MGAKMKKLIAISVFCAFFANQLFPGEVVVNGKKYQTRTIKTLDGKVYKDVIIGTVTPASVDVHCTDKPGRIVSIPLKDLPEDLKTEFGYNPEKAKAYRKKEAKVEAKLEKKIENAGKTEVKVIKDDAATKEKSAAVHKSDRINKYGKYKKELKGLKKEIEEKNRENWAKGKRPIMPNDIKRKIELEEAKKKEREMREKLKEATEPKPLPGNSKDK